MIFANLKRPQVILMRMTLDAANQELEEIERSSALGCSSCNHFASSTSFCTKHKAVVPAEFVTQGCDEWQYDDIPF